MAAVASQAGPTPGLSTALVPSATAGGVEGAPLRPSAGGGGVANEVARPWPTAGGATATGGSSAARASKYATRVSTSTGPVTCPVPVVKAVKLSPPTARKELAVHAVGAGRADRGTPDADRAVEDPVHPLPGHGRTRSGTRPRWKAPGRRRGRCPPELLFEHIVDGRTGQREGVDRIAEGLDLEELSVGDLTGGDVGAQPARVHERDHGVPELVPGQRPRQLCVRDEGAQDGFVVADDGGAVASA